MAKKGSRLWSNSLRHPSSSPVDYINMIRVLGHGVFSITYHGELNTTIAHMKGTKMPGQVALKVYRVPG